MPRGSAQVQRPAKPAALLPPPARQAGFYHWNAAFARYNDRQWGAHQPGSAPPAPPPPGAAQQGAGSAAGPPPQQQQEQQQQQERVLMPGHLRLVVTPDLVACLTGRLGSGSGSAQSCGSAPPEWAALFEAARAQARRGEWLQPAGEHGAGCEPSAVGALSSAQLASSLQGAVDAGAPGAATRSDSSSSGARSGASSPEPVATPALASPRRSALAWTIPAEDSDSEAEGEALVGGPSPRW